MPSPWTNFAATPTEWINIAYSDNFLEHTRGLWASPGYWYIYSFWVAFQFVSTLIFVSTLQFVITSYNSEFLVALCVVDCCCFIHLRNCYSYIRHATADSFVHMLHQTCYSYSRHNTEDVLQLKYYKLHVAVLAESYCSILAYYSWHATTDILQLKATVDIQQYACYGRHKHQCWWSHRHASDGSVSVLCHISVE